MDNVFLRLERGNQYLHVAGLGIYDPSSAPSGFVRFKDILKFFESRLDSAPVFRRRLVNVPFDLDRPTGSRIRRWTWNFTCARRAAAARRLAPAVHPGARIHSRRSTQQAAVEAYVIEGLDNIRASRRQLRLLYQVHHCAIDGEAAPR